MSDLLAHADYNNNKSNDEEAIVMITGGNPADTKPGKMREKRLRLGRGRQGGDGRVALACEFFIPSSSSSSSYLSSLK